MRILLVDDDEPLMETLMESLIKQRYAVDIATDGETAQEFVALFSYDLIVLDMVLPDNNGIAMCQALRQQGVSVPILMLTATDTSKDTVAALDAVKGNAEDQRGRDSNEHDNAVNVQDLRQTVEGEKPTLHPDIPSLKKGIGDASLKVTSTIDERKCPAQDALGVGSTARTSESDSANLSLVKTTEDVQEPISQRQSNVRDFDDMDLQISTEEDCFDVDDVSDLGTVMKAESEQEDSSAESENSGTVTGSPAAEEKELRTASTRPQVQAIKVNGRHADIIS